MCTEQIKNGPLPKIIAMTTSVLLIVITFYFLVLTNAKMKETQYIGIGSEQNNVISVSKTGTVYAKPDLAMVTVTSTTESKTASEAINKNREKASAIITFLKGQGIEEKDIKTSYYDVSPKYEYSRMSLESSAYYPSNQILVGYIATESLEVKIRQLDKIGDITTGAVTAGASDVSGLSFTVEDMDVVKMQARVEAIKNAKIDAESIANGLGVRLGKVISFTESGNYPYYAYDYLAKSSAIGSAEMATVPVATGENKIQVTVNISYEIK